VNSYYRGSHGILLVYDLTDPASAISIRMWLEEINKFAKEGIPVFLVGNKLDLLQTSSSNRVLSETTVQETRQIIKDLQIEFPHLQNCECSAKTGEHVEQAFLGLIAAMIKEKQDNYRPYERNMNQKPEIRIHSAAGNILSPSSSSCCGT
jgi:Ras-related protein Rab-1A